MDMLQRHRKLTNIFNTMEETVGITAVLTIVVLCFMAGFVMGWQARKK